MDKGTAWLDTGTVSSLMEASQFVQVLENRQGLKVGCVEEQAYLMNYIDADQLQKIADAQEKLKVIESFQPERSVL